MSRIAMAGVRKRYASSGVLANDGASIEVESGTIHALVGENGAGKSTLMRILYGLERPDSGRISVDGSAVRIGSPGDAQRLGIGMVQQHFAIVDELTVAENVILGREPRAFGFLLDVAESRRSVARTMALHGLGLEPGRPAGSLSVGERQRLEIARLLHRNAEILILDEPTSVLAEREIEELFDSLRKLKASGRTIIVIAHKVREVMRISDAVTVMRSGRTVARLATRDTDEQGLSCLIMGTSSCPDIPRRPPLSGDGAPVIEAKGLGAAPGLHDASFTVRAGEILGLCAVAGNGLVELEEVFAGARTPDRGSALIEGGSLPRLRRPPPAPGSFAYVPSDRMRRGAAQSMSVSENLIALDRKSFHPFGILASGKAFAAAGDAIARFGMRAAPGQAAGGLSGGTLQKLILARELAEPAARAFVLAEPTWGLDIAATNDAYEKIIAVRDSGGAVLLISSDLDEILALSDRIAVMFRGKIAAILPNDGTATREILGEYMLGARQ